MEMSSYAEDLASRERLEKLRLLALVVAFGLALASAVLDLDWLLWPRAFAWVAAGVVAFYEGRAMKRLGRDPDASYLRAIAIMLVAAVLFYQAAKG